MLSFLKRLFNAGGIGRVPPLATLPPEPPVVVIVDGVRVQANFTGGWRMTESGRHEFAQTLVKQCREGAFIVPKGCELTICRDE